MTGNRFTWSASWNSRVGRWSARRSTLASRSSRGHLGLNGSNEWNERYGHPAALTHCLQTVATSALLQSVDQCGHDEAPTGWPIAIAPPLTLVLARSAPVGGPGQCRLRGAEVSVWTPSLQPSRWH